jgi:uncharacterized membrane protein YdcZ (DUF606 family)
MSFRRAVVNATAKKTAATYLYISTLSSFVGFMFRMLILVTTGNEPQFSAYENVGKAAVAEI